MSRPDRLLRLLHLLRSLPPPVTAQQLASSADISLRSVYRDIDALRASGAEIDSERGYGYTLINDGTLRPQTFTRIEIEAIALGMAEVRHMGDPALAAAAEAVLARVAATLPSKTQEHMVHAISHVRRFDKRYKPIPAIDVIREACWDERALSIDYTDRNGDVTQRTVWPLAVVYLEQTLVLLARCCLREGFRMFLLNRIDRVEATNTSFRPRRAGLLRKYLRELKEQHRPDKPEAASPG
ncbi:WYL domain-containing protein [Bacillus sp. NP157]|nr:WYL domain-containing protein [Bacillus sp. NP157]